MQFYWSTYKKTVKVSKLFDSFDFDSILYQNVHFHEVIDKTFSHVVTYKSESEGELVALIQYGLPSLNTWIPLYAAYTSEINTIRLKCSNWTNDHIYATADEFTGRPLSFL